MSENKADDRMAIEDLPVPSGARWVISDDDTELLLIFGEDPPYLSLSHYANDTNEADSGFVMIGHLAITEDVAKANGYRMIYRDFIEAAHDVAKVHEASPHEQQMQSEIT